MTKMFLSHLLAVFCWSVALAYSQHTPDMYGLINILYMKADPDLDGKISLENLTEVYLAMDVNNTGYVTRAEFSLGWQSLSSQSSEMADAYFDLSDIDGNGQIDERDTQEVFKRFDVNNNGYISDQEFVAHFVEIYFTVPVVVLFRRLQTREGTHGDVTRDQFETLLFGLKGHAKDGSVTKEVLENDWVAETFGTSRDADKILERMDENGDDVISTDELGSIFDFLDRKDSGMIGFDQIRVERIADSGPSGSQVPCHQTRG